MSVSQVLLALCQQVREQGGEATLHLRNNEASFNVGGSGWIYWQGAETGTRHYAGKVRHDVPLYQLIELVQRFLKSPTPLIYDPPPTFESPCSEIPLTPSSSCSLGA